MIASLRVSNFLKPHLLALIVGFHAFAPIRAAGAERKEATPDTRLFTQEFPMGRHLFKDAGQELFVALPDGGKKRVIDVRQWFTANGVLLPREGSALYDPEAKTLAVTGSLADLDAAMRTFTLVHDYDEPPMVRTKMALVRALESVAADGEPIDIDSFDEFKTLAAGKLVTVAALSGIARSGNRVQVAHDATVPNTNPDTPPIPPDETRRKDPELKWPPPPGVERAWFEAESVIGPGGQSVDTQIHFRFISPASGADPLLSVDYQSGWSAPIGLTHLVKTFTAKPKAQPNRLFYYALLVTADIIEADGSVRQRR